MRGASQQRLESWIKVESLSADLRQNRARRTSALQTQKYLLGWGVIHDYMKELFFQAQPATASM